MWVLLLFIFTGEPGSEEEQIANIHRITGLSSLQECQESGADLSKKYKNADFTCLERVEKK